MFPFGNNITCLCQNPAGGNNFKYVLFLFSLCTPHSFLHLFIVCVGISYIFFCNFIICLTTSYLPVKDNNLLSMWIAFLFQSATFLPALSFSDKFLIRGLWCFHLQIMVSRNFFLPDYLGVFILFYWLLSSFFINDIL